MVIYPRMTCRTCGNDFGNEGYSAASWESVNESAPSWGCWGIVAAAGVADGFAGSFASFWVCSYYIRPVLRAGSDRGNIPDLCPGSNTASGSPCSCLETHVGSDTPVCDCAPGCGAGNGILTESET